MKKLRFYVMKERKFFTTDKYKLVTKSNRRFAMAVTPKGNKCCLIVSKDFRG